MVNGRKKLKLRYFLVLSPSSLCDGFCQIKKKGFKKIKLVYFLLTIAVIKLQGI